MGKRKHDRDGVKHVCPVYFLYDTHTDDQQDVDSRQTCTICHINVNVGTGGPKNFEIHLASKKHLRNVKAAEDASKASKCNRISNFFVKQRDPPPPYQAPPAPQLLALKPSTSTHAVSSTDNLDVIDVDANLPPSSCNRTGVSATSSTHPLITHLCTLSSRLPEIVPIGQESDPLAVFSGDPRDLIVADSDDDLWESVIDPTLNRVIGFGISTRQIADIIRRGPFGIDGFCQWIKICTVELKISPALLEMRLERVSDALKLLYVPLFTLIIVEAFLTYFHFKSGATDKPENPSAIEPKHATEICLSNHEIVTECDMLPQEDSHLLPLDAPDDTNQNKPHAQSISDQKCYIRRRRCRGIQLDFGDGANGRTPAFSYPAQIHGAKSVPWTTLYSGNELWIRSDDCKSKISGGSDEAVACSPCLKLLTHPIIQGIIERDALGARENTPYQWLSHHHISELLHHKNQQINALKLTRLNLERSLLHRARSLSDFKRFVFAVSRGNIPRLHSLVATAQKRGSSINRILELINLAVQQVYKPKSYSEIDFQRQYLFLKLGGRQVAELAYRTSGLPSRDVTLEHIQTKPLIVSAKMPTLSEMTENLKVSFRMVEGSGIAASDHAHRHRGPGYQKMADELKVESRLRWDASRNIILGPCREHVKPYSVEFCTMDQPQALAEGIRDKRLHFATEVQHMF